MPKTEEDMCPYEFIDDEPEEDEYEPYRPPGPYTIWLRIMLNRMPKDVDYG